MGSLLKGESEALYTRNLYLPDETLALARIWHCLKLMYGYRENNPMTEIYKRSTRPSVESNSKGLRSLHKDLIFCLGKIESNNAVTLDKSALVNNFVKLLPHNFRNQYIPRTLDHDISRTFSDLMTYLARYIRAVERDPDDWVDTIDPPKKNVNNITRGRSNQVRGLMESRGLSAGRRPDETYYYTRSVHTVENLGSFSHINARQVTYIYVYTILRNTV